MRFLRPVCAQGNGRGIPLHDQRDVGEKIFPQGQALLQIRPGLDHLTVRSDVDLELAETLGIAAAMVPLELSTHASLEAQVAAIADDVAYRSEEHTSELQSLMRISYAVFCLKKKKLKMFIYSLIPKLL